MGYVISQALLEGKGPTWPIWLWHLLYNISVSSDCVLAVSIFLGLPDILYLYIQHTRIPYSPRSMASMSPFKVFQEFSLENFSTRYNSRQVPGLDICGALLSSSCKNGLSLPRNHTGKSVEMLTSPSSDTSCVTLVKALYLSVMHPRKRRFYQTM